MYNHACPDCGGTHVLHNLADEEALPPSGADWERVVADIFEGELAAGSIDVPTATAAAQQYMEGVFKGFGGNFSSIDYNTPDYGMLTQLERNVYQFSAAKNYQELRALSSLLHDGEKLRSYTDFRREAMKVVDEWNNTWAKTEYNTAISGAINARKYNDFKANAAIMPNLKYRTVGDLRVREAHRLLDGVIRPVDDAFWKTYFPPNGWGCRCTALQMPGHADPTPTSEITYPDVPKMFQVNLAEQGLVFPKGHPYFDGIPKRELNKFVKQNLPDRAK